MSIFHRNESVSGFVRTYPITSLLFVANVIMFLLLSLNGGSTNSQTLLTYGAYFKPLVESGDWYRLVSSMFLHIGFQHLLFNMFSLVIFAATLERIIGSFRYSILYFISGIGGSLACYFFAAPNVLASGASGALFGVFGCFLFMIMNRPHLVDPQSKQIFLVILVLNLGFTFFGSGISVEGHLGGFFAGYLVSYIIFTNKN